MSEKAVTVQRKNSKDPQKAWGIIDLVLWNQKEMSGAQNFWTPIYRHTHTRYRYSFTHR